MLLSTQRTVQAELTQKNPGQDYKQKMQNTDVSELSNWCPDYWQLWCLFHHREQKYPKVLLWKTNSGNGGESIGFASERRRLGFMAVPALPELDSLKKGVRTLPYPQAHRNTRLSLTCAVVLSKCWVKTRGWCFPVTPQLTQQFDCYLLGSWRKAQRLWYLLWLLQSVSTNICWNRIRSIL